MNKDSMWNVFKSTGSINAYMQYKNAAGQDEDVTEDDKDHRRSDNWPEQTFRG